MDSLPVTLIVKAPNQQIEDQKIRCETSWSINKLKQHLSEVYPSKPPHHEQKLIYSGQLLNDTVILKDILRQYEGQDTHTVHLVCTPQQAKMATGRPKQQQASPVSENSSTTAREPTSPSPESLSGQAAQQNHAAENNRVPPAYPNAQFAPNGFPAWAYLNGQMPQAPQMDFNALNQYQMQMAWMQQAYLQYVQAQYMQLASGQPLTPPPHTVPSPTPPPPNNHLPNQPNQPEAAPQPAQDAAGAPPPPENEERDWLDVFYMLSRAMVLFSVVYFYSSPLRFVFVLFLGVALYLYQAGFFRNININNNNNLNGAPDGAAPPEEDPAPTRMMVAWTFLTTFFASLVPEVQNINA